MKKAEFLSRVVLIRLSSHCPTPFSYGITIMNTSTSILANFFSYISLSYNSDRQSDYNDICFINRACKNKGSEQEFEIESHTVTSSYKWGKIDSLPAERKMRTHN
jgi:hypothetical protein